MLGLPITDEQLMTHTDVSPSYLHYMGTTSLARSRPAKILFAGFSHDDWLGLKALFEKAERLFNDGESKNHEVITLMRAMIHQCHRALVSHSDLILGTPGSKERQSSAALRSPDQQFLYLLEHHESPTTAQDQGWTTCSESERKIIEFLGELHGILGTALFYFGKIIGKDESLALPGEPNTALPYWLSALDVFESGYNLPLRTNASYACREHWLLAVSGGRVLIALIGQFITEKENKRSPSELFTRDSKWAHNSPLGTIVALRPPPMQRMALSLMSLGELMLIATDQFMRGILHMPHHASTDLPHFSRAGKLLTIATEVLEVVERLSSFEERRRWALWVQSVLNLIKPEMTTEEEAEHCVLTRLRCCSLVDPGQGTEVADDSPTSPTHDAELLKALEVPLPLSPLPSP
ncbi:hypothetical protein EDC04DRAFT_2727305 [Pisolithus marmoratus]|nr:hypothetical protein EDC04DRAFT_2727305 [Pisolithus marmoratus]